jgi:hypothetical protein
MVVVPVIYTYLDDAAAWAKHKWHPVPAGHGSIAASPLQKNDDIV